MAIIEITSALLRVQIDEDGAQLRSIYHTGEHLEYLWQRDADIWSSSAPVVFPVIGKLHQLRYQLQGVTYPMKSNGIIRYSTLSILDKGEHYVELLFVNDEEHMRNYPYACRFKIRYEVIHNTVQVCATIYNDDYKTMYYNYAGHPGFNIPLYAGESCNDYYIEFKQHEKLTVYDVCASGQLLKTCMPFFEHEKRFFIRKNLFQKEALVFRHPVSDEITIKSLHHNKTISVKFPGFDNLAIWSPYIEDKELCFICVEPWIGHSDFKDYAGDFTMRDEIASLEEHEQIAYTYTLTFDQ